MNEKEMRFDFTHFSPLTSEEIAALETRINGVILQNLPVTTIETTPEDAKKRGAMALFGEKYGDTVRMVDVSGFSIELCGGTHVAATGEIGMLKIVSEASVASGVRRIEAYTGLNALDYVNRTARTLALAAATLKCSPDALPDRASAVAAELKNKEKELDKLKAEIAAAKAGELFKIVGEACGIRILTADAGEADANALRTLLDGAKDDASVIVAAGKNTEKGTCTFVAFCGKEAIARGAHAGNIVRAVAQLAGGNGGGKPDSAMAGGREIAKIGEALAAVPGIVTGMLK